jgi:fibronectin-binding autotransporter adhesin
MQTWQDKRMTFHLAAAVASALFPALTLAVTFNWNGGDFITGVTAPEPMTALDDLQINAGSAKRFVGSTFTNLSLVQWQADALQGGNGAVVTNHGEWRSASDGNTLVWAFGGQAVFVNAGTFSKSAGTTTNVGTWQFQNNGGLIDAQTGTIVFNGSNNIFNDGSRFSGAGQVQISGNSAFSGSFQSDNLTFTGGSNNGTAAVFAGGAGLSAGQLGWSGGDLTGDWTLAAGTTTTATGAAVKRQVGATIVNNGTFRWASAQQWQAGNGSRFTNNGLLEATETATFNWNFGGQHQLLNAASGTLRAVNNASLTIGEIALVSDGGLFEAGVGSAIHYAGSSNRFNDGTRFVGFNRVTGNARFVDDISANELRFASGTQTGGDGVTPGSRARLSGAVLFEGGDLAGAWEIKSGATVTSSGATVKRQVGSDIINNGTLRWASTQQLQGGNGSQLTNNGLIEVTESALFNWNFGGQHQLRNAASGTVRATDNASLNIGNLALTSDGGLFEASAGSAIEYSGSSNRFNGGTRFLGLNRVTGNARFVDLITADDLRWISGTQTGGDGVTVGSRGRLAGAVGFEGGDLAGAWEIMSGTTFTASGAAGKRQVGSDILNNGTFRWANTQQWQGGNGSLMTNNALIEATASALFNWNFGGQHQLINAASGTVRAANGATLSIGNIALTSNGGLFEAVAGSAIEYAGASNRFNDGTRFAGLNRVTGNARFVDNISADDLHLVAGTQTGGDGSPASFARLGGQVHWLAGDLSGQFEIRSGATLDATTVSAKRQVGSLLVNNGTIAWNSAASLQGGNGSRLVNNGRFEIMGDADLTWNFGGQARFDNDGLLVKSAGAGTSSLATLALTNTGTIAVHAGALELPANFVNDGTLGGTATFSVSGTLFNNGHLAPGASPGTLNINGSLQQSALGTLDIELENAFSHDLLLVGGNASLGGTLGLSCFAACSYAVGEEILILDAVGQLTGSFASVVMTGFGSGAFDVVYDSLNDRVLLRVTEAVTSAVPLPGGAWLLLGGVATLAVGARRRRAA